MFPSAVAPWHRWKNSLGRWWENPPSLSHTATTELPSLVILKLPGLDVPSASPSSWNAAGRAWRLLTGTQESTKEGKVCPQPWDLGATGVAGK